MNPKRKFIGHVVNGGPVTVEEGIKAGIIKNPVPFIKDKFGDNTILIKPLSPASENQKPEK